MKVTLRVVFVSSVFAGLVGCDWGSDKDSEGSVSRTETFELSAPAPSQEEDGGSIYFNYLTSEITDNYFSVDIKITNNSESEIWNAGCDVKLLNESSIIDTTFVYFADGATINPGENAINKAYFSNISEDTEFTKVMMQSSDCTWLYR